MAQTKRSKTTSSKNKKTNSPAKKTNIRPMQSVCCMQSFCIHEGNPAGMKDAPPA